MMTSDVAASSLAGSSAAHGLRDGQRQPAIKGQVPLSFWAKRRAKSPHLTWFWGESIAQDVAVAEIQRYGLGALLESNIPLCYFLYYLLDNYCSENLFFYIEVEAFEAHKFKSKEEIRKTARQLYTCFIKEKSDFEVNLDARVTKPIKAAIENCEQTCFSDAKQAIFQLLEPMLVQFTLSPVFQGMCQQLGMNNTVYSRDDRNAAIDILLKHLDKSRPSEVTGVRSTDEAIAAERTRARLIRNLTHSFCKTRLHCDFYDNEDKTNLASLHKSEKSDPGRF